MHMPPPLPSPARRPALVLALAGVAGAFGMVPAAADAQFPPPATDGAIVTAAGTTSGFSGDGGPATQAQLTAPSDVAVLADGSIAIADTGNDRIRRITSSGNLVTAAGSSSGTTAEGAQATQAELAAPRGVTALPGGGFLVVDTMYHRVRRVGPDGVIFTVAGSSVRGPHGDGGPALAAQLDTPSSVALMPDGGFLIADTGNHRIRRVLPDGRITTIAGGAVAGFVGDGGPAGQSLLSSPRDVAVATDGAIVIVDSGNARLRRFLEILDENNYPVEPNNPGKIVVTDLTNFAMPIIRYEIGDIGVPIDTHGDQPPSKLKLLGRTQECLITRNNRLVTTRDLQNTFLGRDQIINFKLEVLSNDLYRASVVCTDTFDDKTLAEDLAELLEVSKPPAIKKISFITPESSGKYVSIKTMHNVSSYARRTV